MENRNLPPPPSHRGVLTPSPRSSTALNIQKISGVLKERKFAEAANQFHQQFFRRVLYNTAFSARFHTRRFLNATKVTYFTTDLPKQDLQRDRAMLESFCPPTTTFTLSQEGSSLHSLEMSGFCIYKALKVLSQKIQLFLLF